MTILGQLLRQPSAPAAGPIPGDSRVPDISEASAGWLTLERAVCLISLFLIGWRHEFHYQLTYGSVAALVLCPIWIGRIRRYRFGPALFVVGGLACVSGLLLTAFSRSVHRYHSVTSVMHGTGLWLGTLAAVGVVLWARTIMTLAPLGVAYGAGMLLGNYLNPDQLINPWKFIYSIPVAIIALAIASRRGSRVGSLAVLLILAGVSALLDSRSLFGALLLSAILIGWQLRPRSGSRPLAWGWTLLLLSGLAASVYNLAQSMMLDGFFGPETQQRTQVQVQTAGSLILGGRPELAATLALFRHDPFGFGLGVAPNVFDVMTAKAGMIKLNYDPENGYVEKYMFGGHVELHSTAGDLWAMFGLPGVAVAASVLLLCIRALSRSMSARAGNGLLIFLVCDTLWNLPFSPFYSSVPTLVLALGLVLSQKDEMQRLSSITASARNIMDTVSSAS